MILVVGGRGAGKRAYVEGLGYPPPPGDGRVLYDLHVFLRGCGDVSDEVFGELLCRDVVVCDEIGCGIVPMEAEERAWRDRVGRTCARLAARAERVVRVCCGIPIVIKGAGAGFSLCGVVGQA